MPLSENNFILSQSSSSKLCLLLCSLYWCSCTVEMDAHPIDNTDENYHINYKDEPNDINAIFNAESREWHPWQQMNPNLPIVWSLFTLPTKYTKPLDYYPRQLNKVLNSLRRHIKKETFSTEFNDFGKSIDEKRMSDMKESTSFEVRMPTENHNIRPIGTTLPKLWPSLTTTKQIVQIPTDKLVATRMSGGKKSDNDIVYRDGFLGVRG